MSVARTSPITPSLPEDLTGSRIGRFVVRSKLGTGGMGEVYYAEDTKLQRPVALKRVAHHLGADPEGRLHILREAQRACALASEHIASVYDVVEHLDELFLVMEYVEGITLRRRLQNTGRLGLDSFFHVASQCAEALDAAHQKGIIHHDIKPENIMLTPEGQVKILDFGLARRLHIYDDTTATASWEIQSGGCVGTSGYMAPEVLLSQELDARSDIFSLGVVFYEMLTGCHPFDGRTPIATADRILHGQPPGMEELAAGVPVELERIVVRMLAKNPKDRYSSAAGLHADLCALQRDTSLPSLLPSGKRALRHWFKTAIHFGAAMTVVVLLIFALQALWPRQPPLPEKKHLAVLPFVPAGDDPEARAFCQGLTETLTARLTQLTGRYPLQVVSAGEIRTLPVASLEQARAELGVNLVLEGSFHQLGNKMRVTYSLVDARTLRVLRADAIAADAGDPFALEDRVVESALHSLDLELGAPQQALAVHGTAQPAAYDFYLRGRGYLQEYQKPENVESAIELFQRALENDPDFALAYAGLGESYWQKYELTHDRQWVPKALQACQRANADGRGSNCLGMVYNGTGRYEQAESEFQRALQVDPTNDGAYRGLAFAFEHMNKMEQAEQTYRRAISARPEYWAGYNWLGTFLYRQARYDEATRIFAQVTALAPDNVRAYNNLGGAYLALGRYADAIPVFERSVSIRPSQDAYANLGAAYLYTKRFPEASRACEQAVELDARQPSLWGNLGDAYYWQPGRRAESVVAYRKAIALGEEQWRVNPRNATLLSYLAVYHAMLREEKPAWASLDKALALAPTDAEVRFNAALAANQLGDENQAVIWLQKALDAGLSPGLVRDSPNFDNLRSSKRFQELLREKKSAS